MSGVPSDVELFAMLTQQQQDEYVAAYERGEVMDLYVYMVESSKPTPRKKKAVSKSIDADLAAMRAWLKSLGK